ncbi:N-acetylmuramoyl-L-alanine amidase [Maribacter sp. PR1]|uniref:N-acetylmuramoyl-L-alanine amidase n=1 Tax=Maribacter cobaltidurans TaxID=1178778 RepID=A0ABU7IWL5_9FLAO|nr:MULTISPECIES: N-acetylmuramoyl-L-alanine amidase [Maribacter]MDC6389796.1 N-acetylmuramoyl-L-alanine amidase [Maribacter sp. PR1]MEE1977186.1 N-acetylmuramoyl-L-alanine amidase [Maribacter cobaltidurans]
MKIKSVFVLLILSFSTSFCWINAMDLEKSPIDPFVVVLDAGHGGHDPGNLGNGYLEKNIALNIVLKVGEILSANKDIKVIYTRKDDTFIDLFVRGEIANKANADLFVSVHCDSHSSDAHGAGTFVLGLHANKQNFEIAKKENSVIYLEDNYETRYADYDINSPESVIGLTIMQEEFLDQSIALAKNIQDNMSGRLKRTDRKVKQAGFIVLHQTFMPSVLVETGFLTNKDEGSYLNSKKGQSEMGTAIADAILKYKVDAQGGVGQIAQNSTSNAPKEIIDDKTREVVSVDIPSKETSENKIEEKTKEIPSKEEIKTVVVEKPKVDPEQSNPDKLVYKVQLMASSRDLPLVSDNFKGLSQITKEPYNKLFRYLYGSTLSYREAKMLQSKAARIGYPSAYIVAYKQGERVAVPKELQEDSQ